MTSSGTVTNGRVSVTHLSPPREARQELAEDARRGLTATPKWLPPKHLYDARGSELFERITRLPEYPLTRAETSILEARADALIAATRPTQLVELGSGASRKTRLLLEAMHRAGTGHHYVPLDVSEAAIVGAAEALAADYPWLHVDGYVGDFHTDLGRVPRTGGKDGRRLVAFLGSTIGNLDRDERTALFAAVAASLAPGDRFLLGAHLVAPEEVLVPAYDDAAGVTAEFIRNVLVVLNRELDGDLPVEAFAHRARWDAGEERMTLTLEATRPVQGRLEAMDLDVTFGVGEHLLVEHSHKFRVDRLTGELDAGGLEVVAVDLDLDETFALLLSRRSPA